MLDIKFVRENPDAVKENIRKKFQDDKLPCRRASCKQKQAFKGNRQSYGSGQKRRGHGAS